MICRKHRILAESERQRKLQMMREDMEQKNCKGLKQKGKKVRGGMRLSE